MTAPEPPPGTPRRLDDPTWVDDIVASAAARVGGRPSPEAPTSPVRGNGQRPTTARRNGDPRGNGHKPRATPTASSPSGAPPPERGGATPPDTPDAGDTNAGPGSAVAPSTEEPAPTDEAPEPVVLRGGRPKGSYRSTIEWLVVLAGAVLVAVLLRAFVFQTFVVPSASMAATLEEGDRVLVNRLSDELSDPDRGDVVVFDRPDSGAGTIGSDELAMRIVGLPGDSIAIEDGTVLVNGIPLDEPYAADVEYPDMAATLVPADHVFVLGDNRAESRDSRSFGPIPIDDIVGRALLRIWPPSRIGTL